MMNSLKKVFWVLLFLPALLLAASPQAPERKNIVDKRDGQTYPVIKIGNLWWMAKNLNYPKKGKSRSDNDSFCYENNPENCKKYGRLYTYESAMRSCPSGYRLPDDSEWRALKAFAEKESDFLSGKALKSKTGWKEFSTPEKKFNKRIGFYEETGKYILVIGTDDFGFSALPGGHRRRNGIFGREGLYAEFWSAKKADGRHTYSWYITNESDDLYDFFGHVQNAYSVRCVSGK